MAEKRIKVVPMMRGTEWSAEEEYKLVDYIVTSDNVVYMCRKVDNETGVCKGHPLTETEWWDKCIDLSNVWSKEGYDKQPTLLVCNSSEYDNTAGLVSGGNGIIQFQGRDADDKVNYKIDINKNGTLADANDDAPFVWGNGVKYDENNKIPQKLMKTNPIAGRYWNTANATPTAAGYYGSLLTLRDLPKKLGLGRYLVTDDRKKHKLDPTDSTKYEDGSPAALDGTQGQCMWCWNSFIANIFTEGGALVKCVSFDGPVGDGVSIRIPAGGTSWIGAGVMDRTNAMLCSVISDAEQFRGGNGTALKAASYAMAPAEDAAQLTMLGMPATQNSTNAFGAYARKRGEGWEANWFVAQFVVEFLFEIIMGTQNSQAAFNAEKDANGLYQGGFGTGVTDMSYWSKYNGVYPVIPTSVGLGAGDGVCLVDYSLPNASGDTYKAFKVPCFFGLMHAGYGHLWRWVRGLIINVGDEKSEVYISKSMFAPFDPSTINDKVKVAECPRTSGYIKRKSYIGLCSMSTEVDGSASTYYCDYFTTNAATSKGLRIRAAGGGADFVTLAGASCAVVLNKASDIGTSYSSPLCYFEEDPIIE